jgi:hypothetical protein
VPVELGERPLRDVRQIRRRAASGDILAKQNDARADDPADLDDEVR